jgi:hypothetical protein
MTAPMSGCRAPQAPVVEQFIDPLPRWTPFFEKRFGEPPGAALIGDFNGDGHTDVATRIGSQLFVFHDTKIAEPTEWHVLRAEAGVKIDIQPASTAIARLPELKGVLRESQSVFMTGDRSAVVLFWLPKESVYAWMQVIPPELEAAQTDARKRLNVDRGITANNMFGEKGFNGEQNLVEQFAGDFDGDGMDEFLALESLEPSKTRLYFYEAGTSAPTIEEIDYRGTKAALHQNSNRDTIALPDFDGNDATKSVTPRGAYIEIWNPEKSGVIVVRDDGWKIFWVSD